MQQEHYDVLIIGAGVVGCSIAYHLSQLGLRLAVVEREEIASGASLAGAGMLAPLTEASELELMLNKLPPFLQLCLAGLHYTIRTWINSYCKRPELILACSRFLFSVRPLASMMRRFTSECRSGNSSSCRVWNGLMQRGARTIEPLLSSKVREYMLSPYEYNVNAPRLTLAYARGARVAREHVFLPGEVWDSLLLQGQRVVGVETDLGQMYAEACVLAAGAWTARWHAKTRLANYFPCQGANA